MRRPPPSAEAGSVLQDARGLTREDNGGARQFFGFTSEMLALLDDISNGRPVRGSAAILTAAKIRLDALKASGSIEQPEPVQYVASPFWDFCPHCARALRPEDFETEQAKKVELELAQAKAKW